MITALSRAASVIESGVCCIVESMHLSQRVEFVPAVYIAVPLLRYMRVHFEQKISATTRANQGLDLLSTSHGKIGGTLLPHQRHYANNGILSQTIEARSRYVSVIQRKYTFRITVQRHLVVNSTPSGIVEKVGHG